MRHDPVEASFFATGNTFHPFDGLYDYSTVFAYAFVEPAVVEVVPSGDDAVFKLGSREIDSAEELTRILRMFDNKIDGAFVRVADGVPFGKAAAAIQACKAAGFGLVSYVPM